jgi:thiamine biosynthesis lipoprotein
MLEFNCSAMACQFAVILNRTEGKHAASAAIKALDSLESLEQQMTVYRESSDISEINREAHEREVLVERRLFRLLQRAQELSAETGGAFDVTAGPLSKTWGFYRRQGKMPDVDALKATRKSIGYQHCQLDHDASTIRLGKPGVEINLGAIGKGHALDRMSESLKDGGATSFLIHGGQSSVLAMGHGDDDEHGWVVGLRHPLRPQWRLGEIILRDEALGTSGSGNQFFRHQGTRLGHVLDPRTGWPVEGVLSATVITPNATDADALATAFFVLGYDEAARYCERHEDVRAIFVLPGSREGSSQVKTIGPLEFREL